MTPSSVLPMIAASEDSTIAATRASAPSVRAYALPYDARRHARLPQPPREPDRPQPPPARVAPRRQGRHPHRRAHGCGAEPGEHPEREDVPRPVEDLQAVRESPHEEGAEEPLERVATGDAERRPDRPRRRDVHQERPQEQGWPDPVAEQQRRGQRDARRRPHRRRARVDEGERQPELPGEEVDAGEHEEAPRYEGSAEHAYLEVLPRGFLVPGQATRGRAGEAYASPAARTASVRLEDYFLATVLGGTLALSATVTGAATHAVPARRRARRALVAPTTRAR